MAPAADPRRRGPPSGGGWRALAPAAAVLLVVTWPGTRGWGRIWGDPLGEVDNHLWMFWRAWTTALREPAHPLANSPDGIPIPLMDPVNLPAWALGALAGPAWGWTSLVLVNVALALAGGWLLAREVAGRGAAVVGMVAVGASPFLAAQLGFGITESWTIGWFGLHAAFLLRHARGGRAVDALAAGLSLGAVALSGWYHAFFGLVLDALLVPALWWRHRRWGLVAQGGVALAMAWPAFQRFLAVRDLWTGRFQPPPDRPPPPRPDWAELPVRGTDLLNFVLPHPEAIHPPKSSYLGLVVLALAGAALVRHPRRAWPLAALAGVFLALALGYWPTVAGRPLGVPGPARLVVAAVPDMVGLSHWERATGAAVPFLGALAALGARGLSRRATAALAAAVLVESLLLAPVPWPRPSYAPGVPAALREGRGGVVQLPFDNGRVPFSEEPARIYNRWQPFHGRPVSENYEGVDALLVRSDLVAAADAACGVRWTLPREQLPPPRRRRVAAPEGAALAADLERLRRWGYEEIVLHGDRCPERERAAALLDDRLGPGRPCGGADRCWPLRGGSRIDDE